MLIRFIDRESTKRNERGCRLSHGATLNEGGGGGGGEETRGRRLSSLFRAPAPQTPFFSFCSAGVAQIKFRRVGWNEWNEQVRPSPIFHPRGARQRSAKGVREK